MGRGLGKTMLGRTGPDLYRGDSQGKAAHGEWGPGGNSQECNSELLGGVWEETAQGQGTQGGPLL